MPILRLLPAVLLAAASAATAQTPAQRITLRIDAFAAGASLSPAEQAAILAEDAADQRADPVRSARSDRSAATFMAVVARATPSKRAALRQQLLNGLTTGHSPFADPQQRAIIARHDPVLAVSPAAHEALTLRSVAGLIDQMRQMAAFGGRPPLDAATIRGLATQLPAEFRAASATEQRFMAFGESDAIALRGVLARQSQAERARYRRTAGAAPTTPAILRRAALNTLLADARRRSARSNGSLMGLERETERMAFSPFLPH